MKRFRITCISILSALMFFIVILVGILLYDVLFAPERLLQIEIIEDSGDTESVKVSVSSSKEWVNNAGTLEKTVGAQYDGVVKNNSTGVIDNWQLQIYLPKEGMIDSSWNGEFVLEEDYILYKPDENTQTIQPGAETTFGFIMISQDLQDFEHFAFKGHYQTSFTDNPLFRIICILGFVWIAVLIGSLIISAYIHRYEKRRKNDALIISQTMKAFVDIVDSKDSYTKGHSTRVSAYSQELARRMMQSTDFIEKIGYIALLHDCGKLGIPDSVLTKPSRLEKEERKKIEEHTILGSEMLKNFTSIERIKEGALYHHERYDGTGYPEGLKGESIPLCARIIAVADAYDAMNSHRCYRSKLEQCKIIEEFKEFGGSQFDPNIAKIMIEMILDGTCETLAKCLE